MVDWSEGLAALAAGGLTPGARRAARRDGWQSALTGLGSVGYDKRLSSVFVADVVDWSQATELWRGDDLAARIIETVPNEMLRQGFELRIGDDDHGKELQEAVTQRWEDLELTTALSECLNYERAYGGAALLLGANDGSSDLTKPLDIERVISFDFVTPLEPRECLPVAWYADPFAPCFGRPAIYQVYPFSPGTSYDPRATQPASMQVHESRLVIFPGVRVSKQQVSGVTQGWGDSVLSRVVRVLRDFNLSWSSAGVLVADFAQAVYGVKGLSELFATDDDDIIKAKMQAVELSRSSARAILIDAEETFERKQTPVSGLPELLDRFSTRLAAAADMPLTLLMGQSPGGLNATGESDIRFFYDRVGSAQKKKLTPPLKKLAHVTFRALGAQPPKSFSIHYSPLWQATAKETAETRKIVAETDAIYITNGVLDSNEVAKNRFGGDEYSAETSVDFDAREALEPAAPGPVDKSEPPPPAFGGGFGGKPGAPGAKPPAGGPPRGGDPRKPEPVGGK